MESATDLPSSALTRDDLADLRDLTSRSGPFATLYLAIEAEQHDAADRLSARLRLARRELAEAGAPEGEIDRVISAADTGADPAGGTLAVISSAGSDDVHVEVLTGRPRRDVVAWSPLPVLAPLIARRQRMLPHVVVLIDRAGADLIAVDGWEAGHAEVVGDSYPIEKNAPGGLSQPRYQRRAESSWEENAGQVAEAVVDLVDLIGAETVAVAGDVRSVTLLREALPQRVSDLVHEISGSRHPDGSEDLTAAGVGTAIATAAASITTELLARTGDELGARGRAATGPSDVFAALAAGQVEVLLVANEEPTPDGPTAWFGDAPEMVALEREGIEAMGAREPMQAPLPDVAIRAALGTGATVQVVPSTTHDHVGALLRWSA